MTANGTQPPGPAADAQGRTAIDPTLNVKEKFDDTVRRLDDLSDAREKHHNKMEEQRRYYDDLLRASERWLRDAERGRLDAIRLIDVTAVESRAREANDRANALETAQRNAAEALRLQVADTAVAMKSELSSTIDPMLKRIDELTRLMYEQAGSKQQVVEARESAGDMAPIVDAIKELQKDLQNREGGTQQVTASRDTSRFVYASIAAFASLLGIAAVIVSIFAATGR